MIIASNIMGTKIINNQRMFSQKVQENTEKLSTGLRINGAKDDAAGLAISERLKAQTSGKNQAKRNI